MEKYDFSGWVTKNNLKCADGRTIMKDAFKHNDGQKVPLVWNHQHNDPNEVLGYVLLHNQDEGVYGYGTFNDTESGQTAKLLVQHGDVNALSIYANQLKQSMSNVTHGNIREVSLVLAGANPGAYIDSIMMHGEDSEDEAIIYTGEDIEIYHADRDDSTSKNDEGSKEEKKPMTENNEDKTIGDVFDTLTDEQKTAVYAIIAQVMGDSETENDEGGNKEMKHNVFDNENENQENTLTHDAMNTIIADGKRYGSLKESFLAHAQEYGIESIDWLFPEAKTLNNPPEFIKRDTGWVSGVMSSVSHTPFSRIKSVFADITEDEARAKGYMKGKLKKEEVFSLLKRTTTPTTIYKKQKLDRDDVIDITDFDVVSWLKAEMRMMLDEEIARAILVGDGRLASSDDKINESNIRPIWKDEELYTIRTYVTKGTTNDETIKAFIRAAIKARKDYKGSGNPVLYTTEDVLTDCLLLEDGMGRPLYESEEKLRTTLRVSKIVTVPVMENLKRTDETNGEVELMGLIVNLKDYNVGADKGGAINMFDDFDIDYNQQKYLIETRCSGALIRPYSAIAIEAKAAGAAG